MNARLLPLVCLLAGCANSFSASGITVPESDLFAFVENASYDADTDGDEVNDLTVYQIGLVMSDREDYCTAGGSLDSFDDIFAIQVLVVSTEGFGSSTNNAAVGKVLTNPKAGDAFVGVNVVQKSGGEATGRYVTTNLIDGDVISSASFSVNETASSSGTITSLSGDFSGTLGADLSSPDDFDTDTSDDGINDYKSISSSASGTFFSADSCDSLNVIL